MDTYLKGLETAFKNELQKFHEELKGIRSNRPSVAVVEDIKVEQYGQMFSIKELGSLAVRPPRDIEITVWDKSAVQAVAKAVENAKAGLSVNAGSDSNVIRVSLPPLTDERRAAFSKLAKKVTEAARIQVRARRDDAMKKLKASEEKGELNEDQLFKGKEAVQKKTDEMNKQIESALEAKLEEIAE